MDVTSAPATERGEIREALRDSVGALCERFGPDYWRACDRERRYPQEFVDSLTAGGYLSALIPTEYGGLGLGIEEAAIILGEVHRRGGSGAALHAQMYTMTPLLKYGSEEQRNRWLPAIADGTIRLQAFAVTEPNAGSNTLGIETKAIRDSCGFRVYGQKVFTSRVQHSDLMMLLARTSPMTSDGHSKVDGLSLFLVDLREVRGGMEARPLRTMVNHETNEVFFDGLLLPEESLLGEIGKGFRYLLDGLNAERILIAAECVGDGRWFTEKAARYACDRVVFDRAIGANQGIQFPIARAHVAVEAADLMRQRAAALFDSAQKCGPEANMAKLLAADAAWEAANVALQTHGGYGFVDEFDIERKFRETRLYQVAPISTNLVLSYIAEHVLGLPRSY